MADKIVHSLDSTNLADILERVLDKGIVIAGEPARSRVINYHA